MTAEQETIVNWLTKLQREIEFNAAKETVVEWCERSVTKDGIEKLIGALVIAADGK